MKVRRTKAFLKDYRKLPAHIQKITDTQLSILLEDPSHPSLRFKKLKGTEIFEVRITRGYRMTISIGDRFLALRRVGTHDILREEG